MNKLKVFEVLKTKDRISSIDIFRFFVISGLLYNNVFSSIFNFDFYYHICRRKIT